MVDDKVRMYSDICGWWQPDRKPVVFCLNTFLKFALVTFLGMKITQYVFAAFILICTATQQYSRQTVNFSDTNLEDFSRQISLCNPDSRC